MKTKKYLGVYAGSFDPLTVGGLWMIRQALRCSNTFVVALGINPDKRYTVTLEYRLAMLRESLRVYRNLSVVVAGHRRERRWVCVV